MKTQQIIGSFFRDVMEHLDPISKKHLENHIDKGHPTQLGNFLEEHQVAHFLRDQHGNTYLHLCMSSRTREDIQPLLEKGLDIAARNDFGDTPLHSACRGLYAENIEYLFNFGADINARNQRGETPLHIAVRSQREDMIKNLLEQGADKNLKNKQGQTAIEVAIELEFYELASVLK